ncbi:MAG: hypothetical protein ACPGUV_00595, partial [Polyangiales bacterium]
LRAPRAPTRFGVNACAPTRTHPRVQRRSKGQHVELEACATPQNTPVTIALHSFIVNWIAFHGETL